MSHSREDVTMFALTLTQDPCPTDTDICPALFTVLSVKNSWDRRESSKETSSLMRFSFFLFVYTPTLTCA